MKGKLQLTLLSVCVAVMLSAIAIQAQTTTATTTNAATVPRLIRYGGVARDVNGNAQTGVVGITFSLYVEQTGGAALWIETQNVQTDSSGHYSVLLGSTKPDGLPSEIFDSLQARWIGVQIEQQAEQPRSLLVSAPYALKAGDAETLGGLPPSAFVLAAPAATVSSGESSSAGATAATADQNSPATNSNVTTTGGTVNTIPMFTTATNIQNSVLTQTGTTAVNVGGVLKAPALGTATTAKGFDSQAHDFVASVYNSTSKAAVAQTFQLQAEPVNNDKSTASGTLNLLYGSGTATPTETGLRINNKGVITFATGQTFPGTGTITGVNAGVGLSGGGTSGTVTLNNTGVLSLAAGIGIASSGGQTPTLSVSGVPLLAANNAFTANNSFAGTVGIGTTAPTHLLEVDANTTQAQIAMVGTGSDAAISLKNVASGGREYWIDSGSGTAGVGAGNFAVWDATAGAARFVIDPSGIVGIGTTVPTEDRLEVDATGPFDIWAIAANGWNALFGSGNDGGDGMITLGGVGDGNPGSGSNGGWGIIAAGGNGVGTDGVGGSFAGGVTSVNGDGVHGIAGTGYAGNFEGNLNVTGAIFAGVKDFKIDHPLDPANRYLVHASVESSEMKNIYDGVVTTDGQGVATVRLPEWFEALNTDFRYQLTVIGQFAQAIVASEIQNHQFAIRTSMPNVKVSWQVTGVRQDAFAKAHPLIVEEEKEARLKGYYIHPELYGAPAGKQIEWARHPQEMKRMQEHRPQMKQRQARLTAAKR